MNIVHTKSIVTILISPLTSFYINFNCYFMINMIFLVEQPCYTIPRIIFEFFVQVFANEFSQRQAGIVVIYIYLPGRPKAGLVILNLTWVLTCTRFAPKMPQKIEILFSSKIFRLALKIFRAAWYYIVYNIYFALCAKDRISLFLEVLHFSLFGVRMKYKIGVWLWNKYLNFKDDNKIPTFVMPLNGNENSFSYVTDTCEYIVTSAVGKEKRKSARYWYNSFLILNL